MTFPGNTSHQMVARKVGDLWVDPAVQRTLRKGRVEVMAANFRADALGVITTSYRKPDRIHIIDGQHRYRAAEAAGYDGPIQTMEYRNLSVAEEAALFRLLNASEKVSRVDQFIVACVEGDPTALAIANILNVNGWTVGPNASGSRLSAIASLERVYALSPLAAAGTMAVITAAYGHQPAAVQGSLLEGLGRFLHRYQDHPIDMNDLALRLSKVPGTANGLVGNARGFAAAAPGTLSLHVAKVIHRVYNQRRRGTALPDWE